MRQTRARRSVRCPRGGGKNRSSRLRPRCQPPTYPQELLLLPYNCPHRMYSPSGSSAYTREVFFLLNPLPVPFSIRSLLRLNIPTAIEAEGQKLTADSSSWIHTGGLSTVNLAPTFQHNPAPLPISQPFQFRRRPRPSTTRSLQSTTR